jgi:DNA-directed RNA polymerase subunit beta'
MDITGGLPRVGELFEARKPKTPAVLAMVSGTVTFGGSLKGKRVINIRDAFGKTYKHLCRRIAAPCAHGDMVVAGEMLATAVKPARHPRNPRRTGMPALPHGGSAAGLPRQGVTINDSTSASSSPDDEEVEIVNPGDTVSSTASRSTSTNSMRRTDESWRRAASLRSRAPFSRHYAGLAEDRLLLCGGILQETTRVLTDAAIKGETDQLRGLKENVIIGPSSRPVPA